MTYPAQASDLIKESFKTVKVVKAHEIARKTGNLRAENTALLGVMSKGFFVADPAGRMAFYADPYNHC